METDRLGKRGQLKKMKYFKYNKAYKHYLIESLNTSPETITVTFRSLIEHCEILTN